MLQKIYPRSKDKETVYLKSVITNPNIIVGDYTMYNDFVKEPKDFETFTNSTNLFFIPISSINFTIFPV